MNDKTETRLDKALMTYKECINMSFDFIKSRWLISGIDTKKLHSQCVDVSISVIDCVEVCKSSEWAKEKECWKKCMLE